MNIIVVGATGFVGRHLVPRLQELGHDVAVVGRTLTKLQAIFPGLRSGELDELSALCVGADMVVYLSAANNDKTYKQDTFGAVNVDMALQCALIARDAGVTAFVYFSSFHALGERHQSGYARSKRDGVRRLGEVDGIRIVTVYLPLVHAAPNWRRAPTAGNTAIIPIWTGSAAFLNRLPLSLASLVFVGLSAVKPTAHFEHIAQWLGDGAQPHIQDFAIFSDGQVDNPFYQFVRRIIDISIAIFAGILLSWLMIITWLSVRATSEGPGIFRQTRVGRKGKLFTCYKMRTMRAGAPNAASHEVTNSEVTKVGNFLRRTKIDELPQLWNVLRGDLSLVGPRPCLPSQKDLIAIRRRLNVLETKPGITGLAQVRGIDMRDPERLAKVDLLYTKQASLVLDVKILVSTLFGNGQGDRVNRD